MINEPIISKLFYYPIKSFRGISVPKLHFGPHGADMDRQWMLVDDKGTFITQRQMPQLARISIEVVEGSSIELSSNGEPIADFGLAETEGASFGVKVWKDEVEANEVSTDVSKDISTFLDKNVKLVRISDKAQRSLRFFDSGPILVLSEASVKGLEDRAKVTMSVARFRPNIVLKDCPPHVEDEWESFKVGSLTFKPGKVCTRCKITQVHPLTGEVGEEPIKTLMTYRKLDKGISFGKYYSVDAEGDVSVGHHLSV
jgi:uncharacterized protein YcbX